MKSTTQLVITLRSLRFEERHRMVTGLSESMGKVTAVARNSIQSRRFGGALDLFAASDWDLVEKEGASVLRLDGAKIRRSFEGLRSDFKKLALASFFNELMIHVAPEHEPVPELFRLHSNALAYLESGGNDGLGIGPVLNIYFAKLLQWSGNQPQIQACLGCERSLESFPRESAVKTVIREAGWICRDCSDTSTQHIEGGEQGGRLSERGTRVPLAVFLELNRYLREPLKEAAKANSTHETAFASLQQALFGILKSLLEYHVPGFKLDDFKTFRFVESTEPLHEGYLPHKSSSL